MCCSFFKAFWKADKIKQSAFESSLAWRIWLLKHVFIIIKLIQIHIKEKTTFFIMEEKNDRIKIACDASNCCGVLGFKGSMGEAETVRWSESKKRMLHWLHTFHHTKGETFTALYLLQSPTVSVISLLLTTQSLVKRETNGESPSYTSCRNICY